MILCERGCGQEGKIFKNGKHFCAKSHNSCPAIKEKKKLIFLEKYGVDNPNKAKEIREKIKNTNLEKYGSEYIVTAGFFREKAKETLKKNYGVEWAHQSKEICEKAKKSYQNRTGYSHWTKEPKVSEKVKNSNLEKYGSEHYFSSQEFLEKREDIFLEKYGVKNIMHLDSAKEKVKKKRIERLSYKGSPSKGEINWLNELNIPDRHRQVGIKIEDDKMICVDALYENTVYEYLGTFWHGNPKYFNHEEINPITKTSYKELYEDTIKRLSKLKDLGYKIIAVWETSEEFKGDYVE